MIFVIFGSIAPGWNLRLLQQDSFAQQQTQHTTPLKSGSLIFFPHIFFSIFSTFASRFLSPKLRNFLWQHHLIPFWKQEAKRNETSDLRMLYNVYQMARISPQKVLPRPPKTNITMGKPSIWRCISYGTWQFFQCHASDFFSGVSTSLSLMRWTMGFP